jgi:hypothetical protein
MFITLGITRPEGMPIRLLSSERYCLVGFRVRFGAIGFGGHVVLCWGCATPPRAVNEAQLCPHQSHPLLLAAQSAGLAELAEAKQLGKPGIGSRAAARSVTTRKRCGGIKLSASLEE